MSNIPVKIGQLTPINIQQKPKLVRTTTIDDENSQNSANMSIKARKFRDIMLSGLSSVNIWDKAIGWFLCVCLQNISFLRETLLTSNVNTYSYQVEGTGVQLYKKNTKMIVSIILGGAGYRGITSFIAYGLKNSSVLIENYAPRSHDFDISFGVKNYQRDIAQVQNVIIQNLIIFLNMIFNELEDKEDHYWTTTHTDSTGNEIFFIPVKDAHHEHSSEKVIWTHDSGLLQISVLKTLNYINIRTNIAIQYVDEKGEKVKELDHIIELVFWDLNGKIGTVTLLNEIQSNNDLIDVLIYTDDVSLNTQNYKSKSLKKIPFFTGNDTNYYDTTPYKEVYPGNIILDDENYNPLYESNNSPYNRYFNEVVNMTFCPIFRLDKLGIATFAGLTGRSSGQTMAKCRQDYSRLFYTFKSINLWQELKKTQGDVDGVQMQLENLTTPSNWTTMTEEQKTAFTGEKVKTNNYSDTNYVQCRTFDEQQSNLKTLANSKFECYLNNECLNSQSDDEKGELKKQKKNKVNYGYEYGYSDESETPEDYSNEIPVKENIPIEQLKTDDINILTEKDESMTTLTGKMGNLRIDGDADNTDIDILTGEMGNLRIDEKGNPYIEDGCLVEFINGKLYYNPNIYVEKTQLQKLSGILYQKFNLVSGGNKNKNKNTRRRYCKKLKSKRYTRKKT